MSGAGQDVTVGVDTGGVPAGLRRPAHGHDLAGGDSGQQSLSGVGVTGQQQRLRGENRGAEHRRGCQRAAEFLEHHVGFGERRADTVELFRDRQRGDADLLDERVHRSASYPSGEAIAVRTAAESECLASSIAHRLAQCSLVFGVERHDATSAFSSASTTRARCAAGVPQAVTRARILVSHNDRSYSWV